MTKKQVAKVIGLLLLILAAVLLLADLLVAKWGATCYETVVHNEFYELEENSIEVGVIGNSTIIHGISGMEMYEDYGISAYNLGSASQPMMVSYLWLKEAVKTQDLKVVVLDVGALFKHSSNARYRRGLENMKLSADNLKEIWKFCSTREDADPFLSYVFKIILYHSRWAELTEDDFTMEKEDDHPVFRGYYIKTNNQSVDLGDVAFDEDEYDDQIEMVDYQVEYLDKIVEYCEQEGLELLLIKTPKIDWTLTMHQLVQDYADEKGVTYLDFSSEAMLQELGLDGKTDFEDTEHLNITGAQKLSAYLGTYLHENYDLTDFRTVEGYDDLGYERYKQRVEDCMLQKTTDIAEYFSQLNNDRYEVLLQFTDRTAELYTEELAQLMQSIGVETDITQLNELRYLAWTSGGECLHEETGEAAFEFAGTFADGIGFRLYSNFDTESGAKMRMNYEDINFSRRGLNILVYDSEHQVTVDKRTIYYNTSKETLVLG